jgi:hypothetical protein
MRFKPNEIYGRVIEIGAMASKEITLERFLSTLRSTLADVRTSTLPVSRFLDALSVAAELSTHAEARAQGDEPIESETDAFVARQAVLETLDRQIADLRAMESNGQLYDRRRDFGIDAPSGQRWVSFDVHAYFECAATASFHTLDPDGEEMESLSWRAVESFLLYGQDGCQ